MVSHFALLKSRRSGDKDITELRRELDSLSEIVTQFRSDVDRGLDNERHEREKFILRVENALLRFERSLTEGKKKRK